MCASNVILALHKLDVSLRHDLFANRDLITGPDGKPERRLSVISRRQFD